jgi:hypothetical protein
VDVDPRFRKEDVVPVWYKRPAYLMILGIIVVIVIVAVYSLLNPYVPGPEPYVQPNP